MNSILVGNKHLYAHHDTVTDLRLFYNLIQEPKTEDGFKMHLAEDANDIWVFYVEDYYDFEYRDNYGTYKQTVYMLHKDEILKELIPTDAEHSPGKRSFTKEYGYQFAHLNRAVPYFEISDKENLAPIYTFNVEQLAEANRNLISINLIYLLTYAGAAAAVLLVYNSKAKKL